MYSTLNQTYAQITYSGLINMTLFILQSYFILNIHTWSELLVPLVNMIKEGSRNKTALLILLIFYIKSQKSNLSFLN